MILQLLLVLSSVLFFSFFLGGFQSCTGLYYHVINDTFYFCVCSFCFTGVREREMFLFNDALNTFYLRLYGVKHIVKDHSDSEKRKPAAVT